MRQYSLTWFNHLKQGLLERDAKQSNLDPCLFYKKDLILITYVGDCLIFGKKESDIDDLIEDLNKKIDLTSEGTIKNYLDVNIEHRPDGSIKLTQKGLTKKIIQAADLNLESNSCDTPAINVLDPCLDNEPHGNEFHYIAVIGMLNFLAAITRPNIAMAVHQCARFSNNPLKPHTKAVKHIARYLIGTYKEGMRIRPTNHDTSLNCHVDADFVGLFKTGPENQQSARSRTGFLITYANISLFWSSKLQTEYSLSKTEA